MKKVLFTGAALLLVASAAFAGGIDLTTGACPSHAGAVGGDAGPIAGDCSEEPVITVYATWAPNEALPDLVGLDGLLEMQALPDLDAASFWNVDATGCGATGLNANQARPAVAVCGTAPNAYTAAWSPAGSGNAIAALRRGPAIQRLAFTVFRPSVLSVTANQKVFGAQIFFNNNGDLGASCGGCLSPVAMVWNSGKPGTGGTPATELTGPTGFAPGVNNCVGFNGGASNCAAVPVKNRSWGQLKSLYR